MSQQPCVSCGHPVTVRFTNRTLQASHAHVNRAVHELDGLECPVCSEIIFDHGSCHLYSQALSAVIHQFRGEELRRIRKKLKLTQREAVRIFAGGGNNSISRYELGITAMPTPLWVLIQLLDHKPELLRDLSPSV